MARNPNKSCVRPSLPWQHIGTLGHTGHGKTTLTAALQKIRRPAEEAPVLSYEELKAGANPYQELKETSNSRVEDGEPPAVWLHCKTGNYSCFHTDCPADAAHLPRLISALPQLDGAILVVSAVEGPMPQTRDHLLLARHFRVPALVVFLNMIDLVDTARVDQVEQQVRELVNTYYPGNDFPILRGSALAMLNADFYAQSESTGVDQLRELNTELDEIEHREVSTVRPFLLPVEDWFYDPGRGNYAIGRPLLGTIRYGESVELIGLTLSTPTLVLTDVRVLGELRGDSVHAGHHAKLLVRGMVGKKDVKRGQVLAKPSLLQAYDGFKASVYFLTPEEGAPDRMFRDDSLYTPRSEPLEVPEGLTEEEIAEYLWEPTTDRPLQFHLHTAQVTGVTRYVEDSENRTVVAMPGDTVTVTVELAEPVALWLHPELRFVITEEGRTVGIGTVTKLGLR
jgi:elongation factor Tu